jgi:hypothetical protein
MTPKNGNTRCSGRTKKGKRCGAAATAGGLCYFHANPNKASELGRIGGRSKRHAAAETVDPLPVLNSALALRDSLARLITDVHAGKLQPKVAAGLAPLLNLQLRAIEAVAKLEKLSAETDVERKRVEDMTDEELNTLFRRIESEEAIKVASLADSLELSKS